MKVIPRHPLPAFTLSLLTTMVVGILAIEAMLAIQGCKSTLETGGAYTPDTTNAQGVVTLTQAPDVAFFQIEYAFATAHDAALTIFGFERKNRAMLWKVSPNIKHTLDSIKPDFNLAERDYAVARVAYQSNPTPANLSTMKTILAKIQQVQSAAAAVVAQHLTTTTR